MNEQNGGHVPTEVLFVPLGGKWCAEYMQVLKVKGCREKVLLI